MLDGKPKTAGKSTFVGHLVKAVARGLSFIGDPTTKAPVVWITEERAVTFRRILERAELLGADDVHVLFSEQVQGLGWDAIVRTARERCGAVGAGLLVIDTLGAFVPGFERSSETITRTLAPLHAAARAGLAVLVVRHERKSGGTVGESGIGSIAMTAGVDTILQLARPDRHHGRMRLLSARSRFDEVPEQLAIELVEGVYVRREPVDCAAEDVERALLSVAPTAPAEPMQLDAFLMATGQRKTRARDALDRLCASGLLERTGTGVRGSPYRYRRPAALAAA